MKVALLQMTSGIDPAVNAATLVEAVSEARAGGARMLFAPEMAGLLDRDRARAEVVLDMAEAAGLGFAGLDPARVVETRARIPALAHRCVIPPVRVAA